MAHVFPPMARSCLLAASSVIAACHSIAAAPVPPEPIPSARDATQSQQILLHPSPTRTQRPYTSTPPPGNTPPPWGIGLPFHTATPNPTVVSVLEAFPLQPGLVFVYQDIYCSAETGYGSGPPSFDCTTTYPAIEILELAAHGGQLSATAIHWTCPDGHAPLSECENAHISPYPVWLDGDLLWTSRDRTLRFPLVVGDSWQPEPEYDYSTNVERSGPIDVPAGHFTLCFFLAQKSASAGAVLEYTFCPGTGVVREAGYIGPPGSSDYWEMVLMETRTPSLTDE